MPLTSIIRQLYSKHSRLFCNPIRSAQRSVVAAAALSILGMTAIAGAQITGFGGSGNTGWTPNANSFAASDGVPNVVGSGNINDTLNLTSTGGGEASSYWFNTPQNISNFTESFTYTDNSTGGADGFAAVWQNVGTSALGAQGAASASKPCAGGRADFQYLQRQQRQRKRIQCQRDRG